MDTYKIFKGVQKPIEFKGFKGKYIYMGLGGGFAVIVFCGILFAVSGFLTGISCLFVCLPGWFFYLSRKQKRGLTSKNNKSGVIIFENRPIIVLK
jgi:hypothetical protein